MIAAKASKLGGFGSFTGFCVVQRSSLCHENRQFPNQIVIFLCVSFLFILNDKKWINQYFFFIVFTDRITVCNTIVVSADRLTETNNPPSFCGESWLLQHVYVIILTYLHSDLDSSNINCLTLSLSLSYHLCSTHFLFHTKGLFTAGAAVKAPAVNRPFVFFSRFTKIWILLYLIHLNWLL